MPTDGITATEASFSDVFLQQQHGLELAGAGGALGFGRAHAAPVEIGGWQRLRAHANRIDWAPDLGREIGSATWWRGAATCVALIAATVALSPGIDRPILGGVPAPLAGAEWEEARTQGISPAAMGSGSGRRMAANDLVRPLAETPERPIITLTATLGDGDSFDRVLQRAGVGQDDARRAAALASGAASLADIRPGTRIGLTLGRRANRAVARPLEALAFRARFDLHLTVSRAGGVLTLIRQPIAIDRTPLRIQGLVGASLYRSARAAGAPGKLVEAYIKALATRLSIGRDVTAADRFDIIADQARAATGEVQVGALQFVGLDQGTKKLELVHWDGDGLAGWFDANGKVERRGFMGMPVAGRITSGFGLRMHPLLGFFRMHKGIDIGAPYGSPIYAAIDGVVEFAGRNAGYGNFVKLRHAGGLASGYGHMSRIAATPGTRVSRGQVIGYVGSTGLSTGPHLHWEIWRNGVSVDPRSIPMSSVSTLSGETMRAFRAKVAGLLAVKAGGR